MNQVETFLVFRKSAAISLWRNLNPCYLSDLEPKSVHYNICAVSQDALPDQSRMGLIQDVTAGLVVFSPGIKRSTMSTTSKDVGLETYISTRASIILVEDDSKVRFYSDPIDFPKGSRAFRVETANTRVVCVTALTHKPKKVWKKKVAA